MKRFFQIACTLIVVTMFFTQFAWPLANVFVSPATKHVLPSGTVKVDVVVSGVIDLHSASITLAFDNTVLRYDGVETGPFLSSNGDGVFASSHPSPGASVNAVTDDQAILGPDGVDGAGTLFSMNFTPLKVGSSSVTISTADLRDSGDKKITSTTSGGVIAVGYPATVYVNPTYTLSNAGGHEFGYDAYSLINSAISVVLSGGTVSVAPATYSETVVLNKSLTITSSGVPIVQSVTVDASSVFLEASLQVSGTLALSSGTLVTGSQKIILTSSSPSAVTITGGAIDGEVERTIAAGSTGSYLFTDLHTCIVPTGTQSSVVVSLRSYPGTYPPDATAGDAINRYYSVSPGGPLTGTLRLAYLDAELNGISERNLTLFRYAGSVWVDEGGNVSQAENYIERTNVSSWSLWTLGDARAPLPITLASFTAAINPVGTGVILEWRTLTEVNNYGFFVQRKREGDSLFTELANSFISGHGTTLEEQQYSFNDATISRPGKYSYRLRQVDLDGAQHYSDAVYVNYQLASTSVKETEPVGFHLLQNFPNPFNPSTRIRYTLPSGSEVTLKVYNLLGQEVETLVVEYQSAGEHVVDFNAGSLANGVYLYTLKAVDNCETKRMVLLK